MLNQSNRPSTLVILFIFLLAFVERTFLDLGPNVELITLAMLSAGFYMTARSSLKLTILLLILTDLVIGNTRIFVFTWSGFIIPLLLLPRIKTLLSQLPNVLSATTIGLLSNIFFYFWTNFGVWSLDSWNMYPDTLPGLVQSYIAGLPFLRLHVLSTLLFVPLGFICLSLIPHKQPKSIYSPANG